MDLETLYTTLKILGSLGGAYGALKAIVVYIVRPIKERNEKFDRIYKELTPNGGGSIKDAISKIEKSSSRIESWQRTRLSHEPAFFFDMDVEGKITWANKALLHELHASEDEIYGLNYRGQIASVDRARVAEEIDVAISEQRDLKTCFYGVDGRCFELSVLAVKAGKETLGYTGALMRRNESFCKR